MILRSARDASIIPPAGGVFGLISIIGGLVRNIIERESRRKVIASIHIPKGLEHIMVKRKDDILLRHKELL